MTAVKFGKLPHQPDSRDLKLEDVLDQIPLPTLPSHWGHGLDFGADGWGELGNDEVGDCTIAGAMHEEMQAAHEAGRPIPSFNASVAKQQYFSLSGGQDTGLYVRDVLNHRQQTGLKDTAGHAYKIGQYRALTLGDWLHLRYASYLFESVGVGFSVPQSAIDQFNAGQTWDVVNDSRADEILGGHYVPIVGHPASGEWAFVT